MYRVMLQGRIDSAIRSEPLLTRLRYETTGNLPISCKVGRE